MSLIVFLPYYLSWHYSRAFADMMKLWRNILAFVYNFFSIHTLLFGLFAPLQRMNEGYPKGADIGAFFNTLVVNTIMRLIGALARVVIIFFGIMTLIVTLVLVIVASIAWIFLPFLMAGLLAWGCVQLAV